MNIAYETDSYPIVPNYEIVRPLAKGPHGTAWLARQFGSGMERVLKIVPVSDIERVLAFERGIEEVRDAPETFLLSDHGRLPGAVYFAHPRMDGMELSESLASLDGARALSHLSNFSRQIGAYHRRGWVHGNLTPTNIYALEHSFATTDFSLRALGPNGTQQPIADDLYALGMILCAIVTKRVASFAGDRDLDDPSSDFPDELRAIVRRATTPASDQQYSDGVALADDLDRFSSGDDMGTRTQLAAPARMAARRIRSRVLLCDPKGALPALAPHRMARFHVRTFQLPDEMLRMQCERPWEAVALTDDLELGDMIAILGQALRTDPDGVRIVLCQRPIDPMDAARLLAEGKVDRIESAIGADPLGAALETALSDSAMGTRSDPLMRELRRQLRVSQLGVQARSADLQSRLDFYEGKLHELKRTQAAIVKVSTELRQKNAELFDANRRVVEQHQRIQRDLVAARAIHEALLPALPCVVGDLRLSGIHVASAELSGDCFDALHKSECVYLYVADVTSHGAASAQVTLLLKEMFQGLLARSSPSLADLAVGLQERYASHSLELDVSMQLGCYRPSTRVLETIRLSAPAPVVVCGGAAASLGGSSAGPALSVLTREANRDSYPVASISLNDDNAIYFHTDGAHEFSSGDRPFGRRRLFELLATIHGHSWEKQLLETMRGAHGRPDFDDDLTVLRIELAKHQ